MSEETEDVLFDAFIVKILRINGEGQTVKRAGTGGRLRIFLSKETPNARPYIAVHENRTGRVVFLANIQKETRGSIHPSDNRVVTMFLVDESFHRVSKTFLGVFTYFLQLLIPLLHL